MFIFKSIKLFGVAVILGFFLVMSWLICGIIYWNHILPSETAILNGKGETDLFFGLRGTASSPDKKKYYAETLSPLVLNGLGLPATSCAANPLRQGRLNLGDQLVARMRSKGIQATYCKTKGRSCWFIDSSLSNITLRLKYSDKTLTELFLMLNNFRAIERIFGDIFGHSCSEVSPEESAIISRWMAGSMFIENTPHNVKSIRKDAGIIAGNCQTHYEPLPDAEIEKLLSAVQRYKHAHPTKRGK